VQADETVRLGSVNGHNLMTSPVRRVVLKSQGGTVVLHSSRFDLTAEQVGDLYRQRWPIEVFFRWLKSTIGCQRPLGGSLQAAAHTFYAALVAYLLTLLIARSGPDWDASTPTRRVATHLQRLRARLHSPPNDAELAALEFL